MTSCNAREKTQEGIKSDMRGKRRLIYNFDETINENLGSNAGGTLDCISELDN